MNWNLDISAPLKSLEIRNLKLGWNLELEIGTWIEGLEFGIRNWDYIPAPLSAPLSPWKLEI